jgi:hypothetical protein
MIYYNPPAIFWQAKAAIVGRHEAKDLVLSLFGE